VTGVATGVATGAGVAVAVRVVAGVAAGVVAGVVVGVVAAVGVGGLIGLIDAINDPDSTNSSGPLDSWRNDRRFVLAVGVVAGVMVGVVAGVVAGAVVGVGVATVSGLFSASISSSFAAAQLVRRWHTPVRLMRFLDDARERGVLRTVGPVYQFRHARLQDRLARQDSAPELTSGQGDH
jgi:hypothetical protein